MNELVQRAYGIMGPTLEKRAAQTKEIQLKLLQAHLPMRAAAYLATIYAIALVAAAWGLLFGALIGFAASPAPFALRVMLPFVFALVFGGAVLTLSPVWLDNVIRERSKDIDENLPHGLNYLLALAHAGLPPRDLWRSLAEAKVFGALATEAERITRDLDLFGHDIVRALRNAQERTPSKRFQEFLQGAISAFQSGVELTDYLRAKAKQYHHEETERQLRDIDTMGVMSETFLVMVVAAPLFLIILLTVMAIDNGSAVLLWGFLLSLVFIPLTQVIIGALIKSLNPKVWT